MSRIYPTESGWPTKRPSSTDGPTLLTVWKKSSMAFQGTDGFSVFDGKGRLVYRVDNYSRKNRYMSGGLVLMDGTGRALLTLRPQILSMTHRWNGFRGDNCLKTRPVMPVFSMRRRSILQNSDEAEVFLSGPKNHVPIPDFTMDGCFRKRHCKIRSATGELAAEISRKKVNTTVLLSDDVFSLVVQPGYDCELIMAFVIVMDRICGKPYAPAFCS
ncbi:protein LURP-one-related 5-like [Magnolia sinica]|uniref:protein LURP-one-related 5-like n=1 Tax=Magnolia sinica TaxID=86752 RepID=UPI00265A9678|nr:protein LURP-one-related 5-like [Magnolia sinica]